MDYQAIDIDAKFALFNEHWSPKVIGRVNDYAIKIAKVQGHFTWHKHDDTDEVFIVNKGELRIDFRDGSVVVNEGQMYVVKKGVEHKPFAEAECEILMFEPEATSNTGDVVNEFTKKELQSM